ncbi:UbiA family prenyltransferase [Vibrio hepatarius]|nr:UbiA family prenyltransferase [Vibrio hepatarius]
MRRWAKLFPAGHCDLRAFESFCCVSFFLAAKSEPASLMLFLTTLASLGLVITSGCVVNNIFDRDIDQKMTHKKRE